MVEENNRLCQNFITILPGRRIIQKNFQISILTKFKLTHVIKNSPLCVILNFFQNRMLLVPLPHFMWEQEEKIQSFFLKTCYISIKSKQLLADLL